MSGKRVLLSASVMAILVLPAQVAGQDTIQERLAACSEMQDRAGGHERQSYCEARPFDLSDNPVRVENISPGGTVHVVESRSSRSRIVAIVSARAPTAAEAEELAGLVEVSRHGDTFRVNGPPAEGWAVWQVSFVLEAPSSADVDLTIPRGAVKVEGVRGAVTIHTGV